MVGSRFMSVAAVLALLGACTAPESGRLFGVSTASVELQRDALLACRDQLGYSGQVVRINTDYQSRRYEENVYRLRIEPGPGIDADAAARINACAEQTLIQRFGDGRPMVGPEDVTPRPAVQPAAQTYSQPAASYGAKSGVVGDPVVTVDGRRGYAVENRGACYAGAPRLYRGTLYCFD